MSKDKKVKLFAISQDDWRFLIIESRLIEYAKQELDEIIEDDIRDGYIQDNELINLKIDSVEKAIKFLLEYRNISTEKLGYVEDLNFGTIQID